MEFSSKDHNHVNDNKHIGDIVDSLEGLPVLESVKRFIG